jgi:type VI secretion system protein ImpK
LADACRVAYIGDGPSDDSPARALRLHQIVDAIQMTTATIDHRTRETSHAAGRRGELALALQEPLTVAVRLRAGRQVAADSASFRAQVKHLLGSADQRARGAGYDGETVKLAVYAYIALLDESVLTSSHPMFAEWSRQPLQEEVFGEHMAGENFFRNVQDLLGRQDSDALADLLEVYQLCLLLGFHGRYGQTDQSGVGTVISQIDAKIRRIRGAPPADLAPDWSLPTDEDVVLGRDPWARRLSLAAAGAAGLAVLLYLLYRMLLGSGIAGLQSLV